MEFADHRAFAQLLYAPSEPPIEELPNDREPTNIDATDPDDFDDVLDEDEDDEVIPVGEYITSAYDDFIHWQTAHNSTVPREHHI